MPIQCFACNSNSWCIFDTEYRDWICKRCFMERGGSILEWDRINQENKLRRQRKKEQIAAGELDELDYGRTTQRPRNCKFPCGMKLIWDNRLPGSNKFVEADTKTRHTAIRCEALQHQLKNQEEKKVIG